MINIFRYPDLDTVIAIHENILRQYGGLKGIRDRGILDGCLKSAFSGFGNEEFFKTPMEKIAKITVSLIRNHPFNDGNKRTGIAVMELLLNINGYKLKIDDDLLYKLANDIAIGKMLVADLIACLNKHALVQKNATLSF